ncbi:ATP-binding cassette domain-containing protein [Pedococcus sp. KACC 23699]|uniref:ATP-binding cassette domain-containing protein n=1 Tax=Pedococcus sp. KACC 23699 TaxID=3149228 RepID=A0AAU7JXB9_9MICO
MSQLATAARSTTTAGPPDDDLAAQTRGLTKRFGSQVAVDDLDLAVPRGAVYGFLGPNGSGKTTTIRMLLGLVEPTAGTRSLLGLPIPDRATEALHRVGALVEGPAFHPYLSGRSNLLRLDSADILADPRTARHRVDAALDRVGLLAAAGKRYRAYSLGMRQRLAIAGALLAPRDLLVLDEPTNGLDPQGTREVRSLIGSLASDGATVLVSSHLLAEVEQICTHLGVMREGRMVAQGTTVEVRGGGTTTLQLHTAQPERAVAVLEGLGVTDVATAHGEVRGAPGTLEPEAVVAALVAAGVGVRSFTVGRPSLEDLFVSLTGEGFDVSG